MTSNFSDALISKKLNPIISKENDLFGQFIGKWNFILKTYETDGTYKINEGYWIFKRILNGLAIQDIWVVPSSVSNKDKKDFFEYGTSLRSFNFITKKWRVTWIGPIQNQHFVFDADYVDNEIHLNLVNNKNLEMRWIFYDLKPNMFLWRSEVFLKKQSKWFTNCHMSLSKD